MTKREVIIQLLRFMVISTPNYSSFVVMFSNNNERKEFVNEFYSIIDTIPEWLLPELETKQTAMCRCNSNTIRFVLSPWELKGLTINFFYYSNKLSIETKEKLMEDVYPILSLMKVSMTEFE